MKLWLELLNTLDNHKFYKLADIISERIIVAYDKNPFEVLGLPPSATKEEVKQSFRNLALKYHPDVNPNGEEQFKEVNDAFQKLENNIEKFRIKNNSQVAVPLGHYIIRVFQLLFNDPRYKKLLDNSGIFKDKELKNYYRYQTGRIRVSKANLPSTFPNVYALRDLILQLLKEIEKQDITPDTWQKGSQNIINIISEGHFYNKTIDQINKEIINYLVIN